MSKVVFERALRTLARRLGLQTTYRDGRQIQRTVPVSTLHAVLESMGFAAATVEEAQRVLAELHRQEWQNVVDRVIVRSPADRDPRLILSLPFGAESLHNVAIEGTIQNEIGEKHTFHYHGRACHVHESREIGGQRVCRVALPFPSCSSCGYFQLHVHISGKGMSIDRTALVIVPPSHCHIPEPSRRSWGIALQLATLQSSTNWGCGDFQDLRRVMSWAGEHGADTVGVNPLLSAVPGVISPYSPSSRLFLNPLYIDITAVPEFQSSEQIRRRIRDAPFRRALASLRTRALVDYEGVRALKRTVFEQLYREFRLRHLRNRTDRAQEFFRFLEREGRNLFRFAVFQTLSESFEFSAWRQWPSVYRDPDSLTVAQFARRHDDQIRFHQYLQWVCQDQLQTLNQDARRTNLALGLYHDLPIGVHPDGADAWIFQDQFARGMTIGAPPDTFNIHGQNWGLLPLNPSALRIHGYELFIETVRRIMRLGGMLRIDHALGLFRLFWIPDQAPNPSGVYVRYPVDELLAIIALESVRAQTMVVGEDLGTVTPQIRHRLARSGMLSYRLLLFERTATGEFRRPSSYPRQALVAATTHDLPTLRGFWAARDIELKTHLHIYPTSRMAREERRQRLRDRRALLRALHQEGLLPPEFSLDRVPEQLTDELCEALYRYLARAPSRMMIVTIEDLIGEIEAPNLPGVPEAAYPSWRLKLTRPMDEWMNDPVVHRLIAAVQQERTALPRSTSRHRTS